MNRSPHGTESWFFALEELLKFHEENPGAGVAALLALRGEGEASARSEEDVSLKVKEAGGRAEAASADGVLSVCFPLKHRAKRGTASRIALTFRVKEGWYLQGVDGLRLEAWGGSDFSFEGTYPHPNASVPGEKTTLAAYTGSFEADLSFSVSSSASKGERTVSVIVRFRACGDGACRPEEVLSVQVPVEVV